MHLNTTEKSELLYFLHIAGLRLTSQALTGTSAGSSNIRSEIARLNKLYSQVLGVDTTSSNTNSQSNHQLQLAITGETKL